MAPEIPVCRWLLDNFNFSIHWLWDRSFRANWVRLSSVVPWCVAFVHLFWVQRTTMSILSLMKEYLMQHKSSSPSLKHLTFFISMEHWYTSYWECVTENAGSSIPRLTSMPAMWFEIRLLTNCVLLQRTEMDMVKRTEQQAHGEMRIYLSAYIFILWRLDKTSEKQSKLCFLINSW